TAEGRLALFHPSPVRLRDRHQVNIGLQAKIVDMLFADQAIADEADADPVAGASNAAIAGRRQKRGCATLDERTPVQRRSRRFVPFHAAPLDRKSTRLNSSHVKISYAVFCLK